MSSFLTLVRVSLYFAAQFPNRLINGVHRDEVISKNKKRVKSHSSWFCVLAYFYKVSYRELILLPVGLISSPVGKVFSLVVQTFQPRARLML
jgi:hypothetical protein